MKSFTPVVIESPYKGGLGEHLQYLRRAIRACIDRGYSPYASHLMLAFSEVLDDGIPEQREAGIEAGFAFSGIVDRVIFFMDYGASEGMHFAESRPRENGVFVEIWTIGQNLEPHDLIQWQGTLANCSTWNNGLWGRS